VECQVLKDQMNLIKCISSAIILSTTTFISLDHSIYINNILVTLHCGFSHKHTVKKILKI